MKTTWIALRLFFALSFITGVAYPLIVTGFGKIFFKREAGGSLVMDQGQVVGSDLIAQKFEDPKYFWPRPSAVDYNPLPSGGSNFAPTSADLLKKIEERKLNLQQANPSSAKMKVPEDLLFASGSGLDPHLSPEAVAYQLPRIQQARGWSSDQTMHFQQEIDRMTQRPSLGIIGKNVISVLSLNLALQNFK